MTEKTPHSTASRVQSGLNWLAETVFVVDVVVVGLLAGLLVLAGVNPIHSAILTTALIATAVIVLLHHVWFVRHREEIVHDRTAHAMRERRGF